jgi:ectoine hydroxylase-related dioxygenase (phytanoyl-CoA dioxygenase family)
MNRHLRLPPSPETIAGFATDGVVRIAGAFDENWIAALREAVEVALRAKDREALKAGAVGEGFSIKSNLFDYHPAFREVVFDSPAVEIALALTRSTTLTYYAGSIFVKEPGSVNSPSPWHQDQPYFAFDGWQNCSVWIALDSVTAESGGVSYVRGSHRWGKWYRPVAFGQEHDLGETSFTEPPPDIEAGGFAVVCPDLEPGDCLVHHGLVLHGARGNSSNARRRRGFSIRYTGDDARYVARGLVPGRPRAPLKDGDAMECALYPRVWPRAG